MCSQIIIDLRNQKLLNLKQKSHLSLLWKDCLSMMCLRVYKKSTVHSATNQSINIIQAMLSCGGGDVEHVPLSKPAIDVNMITVCSG